MTTAKAYPGVQTFPTPPLCSCLVLREKWEREKNEERKKSELKLGSVPQVHQPLNNIKRKEKELMEEI